MTRPYALWDPGADDTFVCAALRTVAPGTATVLLAPRERGTVAFEAGQYVTVQFDVDGREVTRCYTIASPPTRPERLALTVGRTAQGVVSPWLHDGGLRVGATVRVGPPQGDFTLERHPAPAYLFLTAGSGITPALSILRQAYDLGTDLDLVLVHSERRAGAVPYRPELDWIGAALPGVRVHYAISGADPGTGPAVSSGRLDTATLARIVPDLAGREVFVCGPDGYRSVAREAVLTLGATGVHEESFTLSPIPHVPRSATGSTGGFRVEFRDHATTLDCPEDRSLLAAAVGAGLDIPFSCTQGLCGTCKSTLVHGEVDMQHNGGIRPREIAAGKILLCCSTPRSDLVIAR